jgi:type IV pilus assembly protein PilY1
VVNAAYGGNATPRTLRYDAEHNGFACRHNNKTSGAYTSGPFDYPSGKFLTPVTNGNPADPTYATDNCPATNHYAAVPRHYWKVEAQWCDKKLATAGDKWLGFGTVVGGSCQAGKDSTHIYPRYFEFGQAAYVDNYGTAAFQRVDLDINKRGTAMYTTTWIDSKGKTQTITRTFDEEMTNYANWFAYYRTRITAVKTVTSLTFTTLDNTYRVGFHTLSNNEKTTAGEFDPAQFVNIDFFTPGQKSLWFAQLFNITIPLRLETPTLNAMARIGDYFLNGTSPQLNGSTDPIILSCQKNWHMLFTDGFTNQPVPTSLPGDQDNLVPALPQPIAGLTTGSPWPHPFREDPNAGAANAASDYSMKYWVTDLRPGAGPLDVDNVPTTSVDPASWQHLNFAAMSLGTQGKLPNANQSLTENLLSSGALQWPQPIPTTNKPDNSGVDDLWHAAINGRGRFVNAQSADELKLGMGQILQDITNQAGSRAGAGFSISSVSLLNHSVYEVSFQPGWGGEVKKVDLDPATGKPVAGNPVLWDAAEALHTMLTPTVVDSTCATPGSCPWFTNRKIVTVNDQTGQAKPFLWANLSAAEQDSLAPGDPVTGQAILAYLRGDPTNEGISVGQFRVRPQATFADGTSGENFLGDVVDSQAVYVGAPNGQYLDSNDPGYSAFVTSQSARPVRIYVGANDGMVHAFDDSTGQETWAFIPKDVYRPDATGLGALAYQDGGLPAFKHHYFVDSSPRIVDVDLGGQNWASLLVGGLGKGGRSYYALDVTDPTTIIDEASVASKFKWEFTDNNMGCSYMRPMIAKSRAFGGRWLVVVASGYNNGSDVSVCNPQGKGDGMGRLFFIDAATGTLLKTMTTNSGGATTPSGLAYVAGYTQDFRNQLMEQIYGGDMNGNFWRFDVSCANDAWWGDGDGSCTGAPPNPGQAALMASFVDPSSNPQPVTTPPQIEVDITNGVDRWVFIGTGRLLDETDETTASIANQQQTFYAIRDGTGTVPNPIAAPLAPRTDFVPLVDKINGLTSKPAKGWFDDLPSGERMVTPVEAAISIVAYVGTSPQDNPCLTGQPATLYVREFATGGTLLTDTSGQGFGIAGGSGTPVSGIAVSQGIVGAQIVSFLNASGDDAGSLDIRVAITYGTTGDVVFYQLNLPAVLAAHRMSWRLLGQ